MILLYSFLNIQSYHSIINLFNLFSQAVFTIINFAFEFSLIGSCIIQYLSINFYYQINIVLIIFLKCFHPFFHSNFSFKFLLTVNFLTPIFVNFTTSLSLILIFPNDHYFIILQNPFKLPLLLFQIPRLIAYLIKITFPNFNF